MADVQLDAATGFRSIEMAQAIPDMFDIVVAGAGSFGEHLERARSLPVEPPAPVHVPEVDRPEPVRATAEQSGPTVEDRTDPSYGQAPKPQAEAVERAPAESTSAEADVQESHNDVEQTESEAQAQSGSKSESDQDEDAAAEQSIDGSAEQDTDVGEEQAEVAVVAQPIQMDMDEMVDQNTAGGDGGQDNSEYGNANGEVTEGDESESTVKVQFSGEEDVAAESTAEKQSSAKERSIESSEPTDSSSRQSVEKEQMTESTSATAVSETDKPDTDRKAVAPEAAKQTATNSEGAKAAETTAETVVAETDVETTVDTVTAEQKSQENGQRGAETLPAEQMAQTDRSRRSRRRTERVSRVEQGKAGGRNAARNDAPSQQATETIAPTRDLASATGAELRADAPEANSKPTATGTQNSQADTASRIESGGQTGRARVARRGQAPSEPGQVDRVRFVRRVARAFQTMGNRTGTVRVRLSPPELGSLRLEIAVRNGAMTARIEAETNVARTLLLDNLPALKERLAQQDIKIERFDVDLMDRSPNGMPDRTDDHAGPEHRRENGRGDSGTTNTEDSESSASGRQPAGRAGEGSQLNVVV